MITKRILSFLIAVSLGSVIAKGQFTVSQSPAQNADCTFWLNGLPTLSQTHSHSHTPFYWAFWIFDNGEYYPKMERTWPTPPPPPQPNVKFCWQNYPFPGFASPNASFNYKYPTPYGLAFDPIVISLPRKGDNPPPDAFMVRPLSPVGTTVTPATPSGAPPFSPTPRIQSIPVAGKYIHLAHSHGYLASHIYPAPSPGVAPTLIGEKSVFVISYKPQCMDNGTIGKVFLYFGAKRTGASGAISSSSHLAFINHHNPKYYSAPAPPPAFPQNFSPAPLPLFSEESGFAFDYDYFQNVRAAIGLSNTTEFRLFEEVQFSDPQYTTLTSSDWSYALAVLTSSAPCNTADLSLIDLLQIQGVSYWDGLNYKVKGTNDYIVGADTIYLKSGEPDDPNRLVVKDICACPTGGGYRVTFQLKYTNIGATTTGATIHLNPIHPDFSFCRLLEAQDDNGVKRHPFDWSGCDGKLTFGNGYRLALGSTATVTFTMIAKMSEADLRKILKENHVAGGDVQFVNGPDIVDFKNELLSESDSLLFPERMNQSCENCRCGPISFCPPWWVYAIGIVVLAAAAVLLYKAFKNLRLNRKAE